MTKAELLAKLKALANLSDTEQVHIDADQLLLEYINDEAISDAYAAIRKWYA